MRHRFAISSKHVKAKQRAGVISALWGAVFLGITPALADNPSSSTPFSLGVQTHFSQGWSVDHQTLLPRIGTDRFRDELHWQEIEEAPGVYDFPRYSAYLEVARENGLDPLVLFIGTNENYDDGNTPHTDKGRAAFARYVAAATRAFPNLIGRIEIGNEYNSDFAVGPFQERNGYYTGLLIKAVAAEVMAISPDVKILCTGAHSVATGYLRDVFETGALDHCDAVSFHPYRSHPEHVDGEIRRLRALMAEFGAEKPLYATEFGNWFEDPKDAPDYMMKMVTLMGAAGVSGAYWYALLNEEWWPNMGLYTTDREEMPAASTFRFLQERLLPLGRPVSESDDGETHLYEFGSGGKAFVAWGLPPAKLHVTGDASFLDTSGNPIDPTSELALSPVIILGDGLQVNVIRDRPAHSAFFGYGAPPWSYHALRPDGREVPFTVQDWNWGPYHGDAHHNPMRVTSTTVEAAMFNGEAYHSVERFTAEHTGIHAIRARWTNEFEEGLDGADIRISVNGTVVASGLVSGTPFEWSADVPLKAGDYIDFAVGPNTAAGMDWAEREITIFGP